MSRRRAFLAAGHRWWCEPELAAWVKDALAPAAGDLAALPGAQVVKANRLRQVVRVEGPGGALFVKRFAVVRALDRVASLVRASSARREQRAMRRLRAAGIACPEPVLLGEARRGGLLAASVLATREVPGCRELTRALDDLRAAWRDDPRGAGAARQALLEEAGRLCARLFDAGADHPDLHLGNLLVQEPAGAPPGAPVALVVLDLHSARLRAGALGARARRARLAKVAHSLGLFEPRTAPFAADELVWLARGYAGADRRLGAPEPLARALRAAAARIEAVRLRSRDRRCLVDSTGYAVDRAPGRTTWRRRDLAPELVAALVAAPAAATVHAHPRGRSVIEVVDVPDRARLFLAGRRASDPALEAQVVRKRYPFPTWRARFAGLGEPLPLRAWKAARACEVRDVPTPRHLALVLERRLLLPWRATLLMERIARPSMIHVLLEQRALAPAPRRRLARDVGAVVGRLHALGLEHRDLAVQNLLVRPRGPGDGRDGWDVWVVDLDEVRASTLTRPARLRALTQLADLPAAATRTDRLRAFRAYLEAGGDMVLARELEAWGERGLGREVARRLADRAAAKARRLARRPPRPAPTDLGALAGPPGP